MTSDYAGPAALLGLAVSLGWRARWSFFHKPTDWEAVRREYGYETPSPPCKPQPPVRRRRRSWQERLTGRTDWDAERRWLGYGRVIEGEVLHH